MFGSLVATILGLVSAFIWAREIAKGYGRISFLRPSTLAVLRREGSALFGVCVGLCSFCLATSVGVVLWSTLGGGLPH